MKKVGKWFLHRQDEVRGFYLSPPYSNVFIGCDPMDGMSRKSADSFDAFVNVSDSPCNTFEPSRKGQAMHWYPVNEMGLWNLSFLFWLKKVLDFHHEKGHRIYLHCHAGAYRSPSTALLWLMSRQHTPTGARKILRERGPAIYRIWEDHGNIPDLKDDVFRLMRKQPAWSLGGILMHLRDKDPWNREILNGSSRRYSLRRSYFPTYYKVRFWWRDKKKWATDWLKGLGWRKEGKWSTVYYKRLKFWSWPLNAEERPKPATPPQKQVPKRAKNADVFPK